MIREFGEKKPLLGKGAYVSPTAAIIGDVTLGDRVSVWPGAVLRGDFSPIRIGERSSIQDNAVVHGDPGIPVVIGSGVSVGHSAVVHGATVRDDCLIGMGAILLNGSDIGPESIVGAGSVVKEGERIPPRSLAVGVPARVVRSLTEEDIEKIRKNATEYVALAAKDEGKPV